MLMKSIDNHNIRVMFLLPSTNQATFEKTLEEENRRRLGGGEKRVENQLKKLSAAKKNCY